MMMMMMMMMMLMMMLSLSLSLFCGGGVCDDDYGEEKVEEEDDDLFSNACVLPHHVYGMHSHVQAPAFGEDDYRVCAAHGVIDKKQVRL